MDDKNNMMKQVVSAGSTYYKYKLLLSGICMIICGLILCGVTIFTYTNAKKKNSLYSGKVNGNIVEANSYQTNSRRNSYTLSVKYSYKVNNIEFTNIKEFTSLNFAEVQAKKNSTSLLVYYDPNNPQDSIIEKPSGMWMLAVGGGLLILIGGLAIILRNNKFAQGAAFVGDVSSVLSPRYGRYY
jgi:hypothetical protein